MCSLLDFFEAMRNDGKHEMAESLLHLVSGLLVDALAIDWRPHSAAELEVFVCLGGIAFRLINQSNI